MRSAPNAQDKIKLVDVVVSTNHVTFLTNRFPRLINLPTSTNLVLVLWHINHCRLFNANSFLYKYHHHHVALVARISLTLSRHSSLSFITLGRSSGQHPVSSHSCWMYVRAGRPAFARSCVGVYKSTSLMSSSLLLQQCPACLVRLTWIVFVMGAGGRTVGVLWGVAARTCLRLHAAFLCNCRLA